jgi:hypothetical protein
VIASVHIADVGGGKALGVLRKPPKVGVVPGLRRANVAGAAPLSASIRKRPQLGRAGLVAFWDDDAALDHFLANHPLADALAGGWRMRLAPLRIHGHWDGVPDDLPHGRKVDHVGPTAVLTLARLKFRRLVPFMRTSAKAEGAVIAAPGLVWTTGLAKPPFLATCSLWESTDALSAYAYSGQPPAHPDAIAVDRKKPFHHESAFIRFRPYGVEGQLDGRNPLPAERVREWLAG